ncbi:MAG: hypothetical protein J0I48_16640 [Devosia sp.]|nr:hypothetical protein [Devosia sp.]
MNLATLRIAAAVSVAALLSACSMGGITPAPSPQSQALQTAAGTPDEIAAQSPALPAIATECPPIKVRPGAEAIYYYGKGQVGNPKDLQYQAVIDKQSRNCVVSNGLITVKMGVVGRFMLGPSGNQTSVGLPLRFAVERDEAPLFTEKYEIPSSRSSRTSRSPTCRATTSPSGSASTPRADKPAVPIDSGAAIASG